MASRWKCQQGHETDSVSTLTACPVCGDTNLVHAVPNIAPFHPTIDFPQAGPPMPLTVNASADLSQPEASAPSSLSVKIEVPGYEILAELGRGGMGVVYKARQNKLNRMVALKMILAAEHAGPTDRARFQIEAEAVAQLQHPNIVQIYEVGEAGGRPYFSLEFVDGGSLAGRLNGEAQPPRAAAALVENIARAVAAAHAIGIVHRDLKPANVLLANSLSGSDAHKSLSSVVLRAQHNYGIPKIADFGLAKKLEGGSGQTQSGAIIGTPSYMSPEQATGNVKGIGPHTDVYALGAILFELLTGRPPFAAETPFDTIMQVIRDEPVSPRSLLPKIPRDLDVICLKCLEKKAEKRYANAADLAADLQRFLDGDAISARAATRWERTRRWVSRHPMASGLMAFAVVALSVLMVVGWVYHNKLQDALRASEKKNDEIAEEQRRSVERNIHLLVANGASDASRGDYLRALVWFTEALRLDKEDAKKEEMHRVRIASLIRLSPRLTRAWFHAGRVNDAVLSPDGKQVLTACADGKARLFAVADLSSNPGLELEHPAGVLEARFASTNDHIITVCADNAARIWDAKTGKPLGEPLRHSAAVTHADFSPDGLRALTASADRTARVWDVLTGEETNIVFKHSGAVNHAEFDSSGDRIVTAGADGAARVWSARDGKPVSPVLTHEGPVVCAYFSPNGQQVVTASQDHTARVWDVETGRGVTPFIQRSTPLTDAAFSPNGRDVVTAATDGSGRVWNLDINDWRTFGIKHDSAVLDITFSPDGRSMATGGADNAARIWSVTSGEPLTPPMRHNGSVYHVVFDKDGAMLLTASQDGLVRLWDIAAGRKQPDLEMTDQVATSAITYSPDRRHYIRVDGDTAYLHDAGTGQLIGSPLQHRGTVRAVLFSPNGSRVLTASADRTARIWSADNGQPVGAAMLHGSEVSCVAFSPDGNLAATGSEDNTARIWDADTGKPLIAPLQHASTVRRLIMSPDGRCLLTYSRNDLVRIWDASTGEPLTPSQRPSGWVAQVLQNSDSFRGWDLPPDDRDRSLLVLMAQWLSAHKVDSGSYLVPLDGNALREVWDQLRTSHSDELALTTDVLAWHRQEAAASENARDWYALAFHLTRLIEGNETTSPRTRLVLHSRRGLARAELGQWHEAAEDYAVAIKGGLDDEAALSAHALLQLAAKDTKGYHESCKRLMEQCGESANGEAACRMAWICLLDPHRIEQDTVLEALTKRTTGEGRVAAGCHIVRGAKFARSAKWDEAQTSLMEGQVLAKGIDLARAWLYLSLVNQQLGKADESQRWLKQVRMWMQRWCETSPKQLKNRPPALTWNHRLELRLLLDEVEKVVAESVDGKKIDKIP